MKNEQREKDAKMYSLVYGKEIEWRYCRAVDNEYGNDDIWIEMQDEYIRHSWKLEVAINTGLVELQPCFLDEDKHGNTIVYNWKVVPELSIDCAFDVLNILSKQGHDWNINNTMKDEIGLCIMSDTNKNIEDEICKSVFGTQVEHIIQDCVIMFLTALKNDVQ